VIDAGFFPKIIVMRPDWLKNPDIVEICSVSHCISEAPPHWIDPWIHNDFGWFNRIDDAMSVVPAGQAAEYRLFAYRLYPEVFRGGAALPFVRPNGVDPEPIPQTFRSLGFDSVSKSMETILGFECSPLSCNSMADEIAANAVCLFPTLEAALAGADRFSRDQPEPGDYYVVEVLEASPGST
jgi:hypothetical protein